MNRSAACGSGRRSSGSCCSATSRAPTPASAAASEALRDFGLGAQVLADLGCRKIRLMIWSDRKIPGLEGFGIDVVERVPIPGGRPRAARGDTVSKP